MATAGSGGGVVDVDSQFGFRRLVASPTTQQGLSLSLSSQKPAYYGSLAGEHEISGHPPVTVISGGSASNEISGIQNVILGSKYLKTTQQLLDEVVNVGTALQTDTGEGTKEKAKMKRESTAESGDGPSAGETSSNRGAELTTTQKQELQMKKAKLVNMLDEVEQSYRQYHHQMEIVVSSFEQEAGIGSAKSYTALALQTISKQFRCLKDAITTQIKAIRKCLGEDDSLGSRLKFADHQLRQQQALQQFGMIQNNAWRPQRGLPERAVSVLRAWLFEHFLHPYPKDSDKYMLAKQTGLTRSQVSNWFINARVRLWKPMVEEMYVEEMKDPEQNGSENNMSRNEPNNDQGKSTAPQENSHFQMEQTNNSQPKQEKLNYPTASLTEISNSTASTSPLQGSIQPIAGFTLIGSSEMEGIVQRSPKKPRSSDMQNSPSSILSMDVMDMKPGAINKGVNEIFGTERQTHESYSLIAGTASHGSGFGTYPIGEIGRFHGNSTVSLTLGLPHCENPSLSGAQQSYLSHQNIQLGSRLDMEAVENRYSAINAPKPSHSNAGYENIDIQNRKRFVAQLLPDFVA